MPATYKPYSLRIPIPPSKEAEMGKILRDLQNDKINLESVRAGKIVIDRWGGKDIIIDAIFYKIRIDSIELTVEAYIIRSRAIIADLLKAIVQNGILSINQMKLVSITNGFGLDEKIETNLSTIAKIKLKEKLV